MNLPPLDEKCPECGGAGVHYLRPGEWSEKPEGGEVTCGVCDGKQRVLTEDGETLLAFLRRHAGRTAGQ
jgi:hypothetical protein